jgi:hypothetical protein
VQYGRESPTIGEAPICRTIQHSLFIEHEMKMQGKFSGLAGNCHGKASNQE